MFAIHVTGLVICAFAPTRLELLMLDASGSDTVALPHHLPTLVARRSHVRSYSLSRLASVHGRFAGRFASDAHFGWAMEGLTADGGHGATPARRLEATSAAHPDPTTPDWSNLHWVLDLNRMVPDGTLRDDYRRLGRYTNAIVTLRGGRARGGAPFTAVGNHIWGIAPGYEQALTDSLDIEFDEPPTLEFRNADNAVVGTVQWEQQGEAWLINEAPERIRTSLDLSGQPRTLDAGAACPDAQVYTEAMGAPGFPMITSLRTYGGGASTGAYCEVSRVDVPE